AMELNGQPLAQGQSSRTTNLPLTVKIGDATLGIQSLTAYRASQRSILDRSLGRLSRYAAIALIAALCLLIPLLTGGRIIPSDRLTVNTEIAAMPVTAGSVGDPEMASPENPGPQITPRARLSDMLIEAGLEDVVTVDQLDQSTIAVNGALPEREYNVWRTLREHFDSLPGQITVIDRVRVATALTSLPPVSYIRLSEPRSVQFVDGSSGEIGHRFDDGWTLVEIGETEMILRRNQETVRVRYLEEAS
ncbi:MAG: hypothetical protein AAFO98_12875, partial [Pseudomonadota bacterium]